LPKTTLFLFIFFIHNFSEAYQSPFFDIEESKERCQLTYQQTEPTYSDEFSWGMTLMEMEDRFHSVYESGRRLPYLTHYEPESDTFYMHHGRGNNMRAFPINAQFIQNVVAQIEVAIDRGYADFVFFPDMGHSHLYFPLEHWRSEYGEFDTSYGNQHNLYAKMFADPELKALYHLAEQLQMMDEDKNVLSDTIINFKYWHRNFLGYNDGTGNYEIHRVDPEERFFNTVGEIRGYHRWSAGYSVQASKDGCFAYKDKDGNKRYFDLGLYDPEPNPANNHVF
jgi:hypothetical protein